MAEVALSVDGGERAVDVLSDARAPGETRAPARRARACGGASLALSAALALGGCAGAGDGTDGTTGGAGTADAVLAAAAERALARVLEREGGHRRPEAPPRWPEDHALHPATRAESIELLAALRDADGRPYSFERRIERLALAPRSRERTGGDFRFVDLVRLSGQVAVGEAPPVTREMLLRHTLGLAAFDAYEARVLDATLAIVPRPSAGPCAVDYRLLEDEAALALRFRQRDCADGATVAALAVASSPALEVEGELWLDGERRALSGTGWLRRAWGEPPPPGGAVVLERLLLELEGLGSLEATRSRRLSGRGPVTTTVRVGGREHAGEWRDAADAAGSGTLEVPALGVALALEPHAAGAFARATPDGRLRGAVVARGSHAGPGFVARRAPRAPGEAGRS